MIETFHIFREELDLLVIKTGLICAASVLTRERRPLGYIDVAALKAKWEAGQADPVSSRSQLYSVPYHLSRLTERQSLPVHDKISARSISAIFAHHTVNTAGRIGAISAKQYIRFR